MKEIPLKIHKSSCHYNPPESASTMVDDEDYEMLINKIWSLCFHGYAKSGRNTSIHRVVMGAVSGQMIDHKDTNRLNNQKHNLVFTTRRLNGLNRSHSWSKSGYMGVRIVDGKRGIAWRMRYTLNSGIRISETYTCKYTAAHAYNKQITKELGDLGFRNDLSNSGFTTEQLDEKLITDRLNIMGRPTKVR